MRIPQMSTSTSNKTRKAEDGGPYVYQQWPNNHWFHGTLGCGRVLRTRGQKGPVGSVIGYVLGTAAHLAVVEPFFGARTYYVTTALEVILFLIGTYSVIVSFAPPPTPPLHHTQYNR